MDFYYAETSILFFLGEINMALSARRNDEAGKQVGLAVYRAGESRRGVAPIAAAL